MCGSAKSSEEAWAIDCSESRRKTRYKAIEIWQGKENEAGKRKKEESRCSVCYSTPCFGSLKRTRERELEAGQLNFGSVLVLEDAENQIRPDTP